MDLQQAPTVIPPTFRASPARAKPLEAFGVLDLRSATFHRLGWMAVGALALFAVAHLLMRGPVDMHGNWNLIDFANHYAVSRAWLIGANPYDNLILPTVWTASGPGAAKVPLDNWWSLMPPGAPVLMAPFGILPAGAAIATWFVLSTACIVGIIGIVLSLAHVRPGSLKGWLLITAAAASAPFQTLVAVGQISILSVFFILLSIYCVQRNRSGWAGILLAAAGTLKPQLALPFGVFYLIHRNWRLIGVTAVAGILINLLGVAQLAWHGHDWWHDWMGNIARCTQPGQANDPTLQGLWRHHIINLDILFYSLTQDPTAVRVLTALSTAGLVGAYAWLVRRGRLSADSTISLSILCAVALLPVYHRVYDAALLALPLAWALGAITGPLNRPAWITIGFLAIFLVPFDTFMLAEQKLGMFHGVSSTWLWQAIIEPHHAWATLGVTLSLLGAMHVKVRQLTASQLEADQTPETLKLHMAQRAWDTAARWQQTDEPRPARRTG